MIGAGGMFSNIFGSALFRVINAKRIPITMDIHIAMIRFTRRSFFFISFSISFSFFELFPHIPIVSIPVLFINRDREEGCKEMT